MRQIVSRRSPVAVACALALLLLVGCDGSKSEPAVDAGVGEVPPAVEVVEPPDPPAPVAPLADPLQGTWWVLAPGLPYMAFRATLAVPDSPGDVLDGSWVSFDWRGSSDTESIMRISRPVAIRATRNGDALVIDGPSPMLDANGSPNGHNGPWSLTLRRTSLPGEPLRYSGRSRHARLAIGDGTAVDVVREFRAWKKP